MKLKSKFVKTVFLPDKEEWRRIIPMHTKENGKSGIFEMKYGFVFESVPATHYLGGAGLISSLEDYNLKVIVIKGC